MTPPPTDTPAALEAAIDAVIGAVRDDIGSDGMDASRTALDRAITAHVEAEVARRLAAAPDVEAAIAQIVVCTDLMDNAGSARARDTLRAAIAADKARAVEAATRYTRPAVSAEAAVQLVARFEESIGHEMRRRIGDDRAALIAALTGKDPA